MRTLDMIVPCYGDRVYQLECLLKCLANAKPPRDMNVTLYLVLKKSGDDNRERFQEIVLNHVIKKPWIKFMLCDYESAEPSTARAHNAGANRGSGDWLFFSDIDLMVGEDIFLRINMLIDKKLVCFPACRTAIRLPEEYTVEKNIGKHNRFGFDVPGLKDMPKSVAATNGGVGAGIIMSRIVYDLSGGWNDELFGWGHEDVEYSFRLAYILGQTPGKYEAATNHTVHVWHEPAPKGKQSNRNWEIVQRTKRNPRDVIETLRAIRRAERRPSR